MVKQGESGREKERGCMRVHLVSFSYFSHRRSVRLACRICNETSLFVIGPDHLGGYKKTNTETELKKREKGSFLIILGLDLFTEFECKVCVLGFFCIVRLFLLSLPVSLLLRL